MSLGKPSVLLLNNFQVIVIFKTQFRSDPVWRALCHYKPETPTPTKETGQLGGTYRGSGLAQESALCPVAKEPHLSPRDTSWPGRTSRGWRTRAPLTTGQRIDLLLRLCDRARAHGNPRGTRWTTHFQLAPQRFWKLNCHGNHSKYM